MSEDRSLSWRFLTNHGRTLLCLASDPEIRLRDLAAQLGVTERRVNDIVADLIAAGYLHKTKVGRRNRYEIESDLPIPEQTTRAHVIGDVLEVLAGPERRTTGPTHRARRSDVAMSHLPSARGRSSQGGAASPEPD